MCFFLLVRVRKILAARVSQTKKEKRKAQRKEARQTENKKKKMWQTKCPRVFYLNLAHREDRRADMERQAREYDWPAVRVPGVVPEAPHKAAAACTRAHLRALDQAIAHRLPAVMILEDDFEVLVPPSEFHRSLNEALEALGDAWHVLFLNMTPIRLLPFRGRVRRVHQALAMSGYLVHRSYYYYLRCIFNDALFAGKPHDLFTQLHMKRDRWYGFFPQLARQKPGFSNIEHKHVDYGFLEKGFMLNADDSRTLRHGDEGHARSDGEDNTGEEGEAQAAQASG